MSSGLGLLVGRARPWGKEGGVFDRASEPKGEESAMGPKCFLERARGPVVRGGNG